MSASPAPNWEATARRYRLSEQAEWHKLLAHFDLAEGFALLVLLVPDADGAALCRRELEVQLHSEGRALHAIEFDGPDDLHRLPEHFLEVSCSENTACLWMAAVVPDYAPDYAAWRRAWEHALSRLNAHRNPIRDHFACTILFAGAPWLQEVFREIAPDLWSVRTLVVRIEPAAQPTGEAIMIPQRIESSVTEGPDPYFALEQAGKLRGVLGKELALAELLHRAGDGFAARDQWREAEKAYTNALELKQHYNAPVGSTLNTLAALSGMYLMLGDARGSLALSQQSLTLVREVGDRWYEAGVLNNLGLAYAALGEVQRAIEFHEQQLAITREFGDRRGEGAALGNLGVAYEQLGEVQRAIEYHEQYLAIAHQIGDRQGEGAALGNLGLAYAALGETQRAIELHKQDLEIRRAIGDRRGEGNALWNMSLALDTLGKQARAIELAEAALRIFEQIEDPNTSKVRRQLEEWHREAA
jgi:tetratricopeptide (TPR) repeat protein